MPYHPPSGSEDPYINCITFEQCRPANKIRAYLLLRGHAVSEATLKRIADPSPRGSLRAYLHAGLREGLVIQVPPGHYRVTAKGQRYDQARLRHVVIRTP